ncbi:hypothetical protein ACFV0R_11335 [Streptomyces sp. NPDC059578]|uniref:hypothetical protein n=1 Tax=Streptomyces sp. NPDC059578 TaxID=3346874 RepID=UPI003696E8D7
MGGETDLRDAGALAELLARGVPLAQALPDPGPYDWLALDEGVRWRSRYGPGGPQSGGERPALLHAGTALLDDSRLALALCHRDGRVRAAALHPAKTRPALLPLVVIRCADWAEPVRTRARELLEATLDGDWATALAPLLFLVGRGERGAFGLRLLDGVLRAAPDDRLRVLFGSPEPGVRRYAYRLAVETWRLDPVELARTAARRGEDPVVQHLCATAALAALPDVFHPADAHEAVLGPLLSARNPRCRSAGVTALRRTGRPQRAEPFLADRSSVVRACARYVVRQAGGDPWTWYRAQCAAPDDPDLAPGAVIGLAEGHQQADAELLWPLLAHPAPAVRARAVAGLRELDLAHGDRLRRLLDDPAPGVVRETTTALLPWARGLPAEWLLERAAPERPRHVRVAALRLLTARDGSGELRAVARLLADADPELRARAERWAPR